MKKTFWTKTTAVCMAAILTLACAGCGKDGGKEPGQSTTAAGTTAVGTTDAGTTAGGETGEPLEFTYFAKIWKPYKETSPIYDELMKRTNTKITFDWTQEDSYQTQLAAKIASKDLPDVIKGSGSSSVSDLAKQGVIVPITDYIQEYMPNYCKLLQEEDWLKVTEATDGEIYGFGLVMDVPGAYSTMIRQDWLDNLGLEMPETWDEWVKVWYEFKEKDANGNGDPNDEIPFAVNYDLFKFVLSVFGIASNGSFSVVDGVYTYDPEHPDYERMLTEMAKLYQDGIFNPEFVTTKGQQLNTLGASNTLGSAISFAEHSKNYTISCLELDDDALFSCVVPIVGPKGTQMIPARNKVESDTYITAEAVKSGKVEQILKFFDYVYSDEGITLTNYGIEGANYDLKDNKPVLKAPFNEGFTTARENGLIPSPIPFCFTSDVYMQILLGGTSYEQLEPSGQSFVDGLTINDPYYYKEPPLIKTDAYVEHFDLLEQQTALRDKCIMGQLTIEDYRTQYEALKKAGLSEVIEQGKAAYDSIAK